ncbi:hypothetical protein GCM10009835_39700 [Planosporangium flavigriseum]|uniref:Uncharacterized protein n=1 Tax=Planosporangium flavigriseum TaxID=373681 RepID=A0A8J3LG15_9ACTN|nr:hypothetical protein Pfl04_10870 [Planosporangium flavigriseum]
MIARSGGLSGALSGEPLGGGDDQGDQQGANDLHRDRGNYLGHWFSLVNALWQMKRRVTGLIRGDTDGSVW